ncbi:unnamed protein product [Tuwongella immobilis]|uniref:Lipoprotein n=1 Tax=Tuwongella immobilis TaxID=692036 RepID=A0A6C2YRZ3_9BACT|nr:unnamed protein product [Tuwongella immobilis]VTS06218.1 unnamed protein product [Tuwongella immobilis]
MRFAFLMMLWSTSLIVGCNLPTYELVFVLPESFRGGSIFMKTM